MGFEANLLAEARRAAGDDTIQDVADFQPKGTMGAAAAGALAGSVVGDAAVGGDGWGDVVGQTAGTIGGAAAGAAAVSLSRNLPHHMAVAVSPSEVYLFRMKGSGWSPHLEPLAKIDRDRLGVEVHQRVTVRTLVLEDLESGAQFKLEVTRLNFFHAKALIQLLMMSDEHHEEEPAENEQPEDEPATSA